MIADVLDREFVLAHLARLSADLESAAHISATRSRTARGSADGHDFGDLTRGDFATALVEVRAAEDAVAAPTPSDTRRRRRGPGSAPSDDDPFLPRDGTLSLLQSALEAYVYENRPDEIERQSTGSRGPGIEITDERLRRPRRRQFEVLRPRIFSDPRWVTCAVAMGIRLVSERHPFNPDPAPAHDLSEDARLLLVGDWGTGVPRARAVGEQMRREIERGLAEGREQHVVHLGDVYYSGWGWEYDKRFLRWWPVAQDEADAVGSWCLNGNHDMYSGGHGYYGTCLADTRFARQCSSSFFRLANRHWQVLGLDTSWDEGRLDDPQAQWVSDHVQLGEQKTMLLTHHPPFSAFERSDESNRLVERLAPALDTGRVRVWFWGHEHRCVLYDAHLGIGAARCLGHGGVPVLVDPAPTNPVPPITYCLRARRPRSMLPWATFGFVVLDFDGPRIDARYIDEDGNEHKRERVE